jgi:hypothetical protein
MLCRKLSQRKLFLFPIDLDEKSEIFWKKNKKTFFGKKRNLKKTKFFFQKELIGRSSFSMNFSVAGRGPS